VSVAPARGAALALGALGLVVAAALARAFYPCDGGICTADGHNLGDLPFHLAVAMGFAEGENWPPEHPELSGGPLTYPFLMDLLSAWLIRAGLSPATAFFWPGLLAGLGLLVALYTWGRDLTGDRLAGVLTPVLVLFSGGLGFVHLVEDLSGPGSPWRVLASLPRDYTIAPSGGLRWGNTLTTLLLPQRSLLLGLPLAVVVMTLWWRTAREGGSGGRAAVRRMLGAGLVAGALPLAHLHSLAVLLATGAVLAILFWKPRAWAAFFATTLILSVPQLAWLLRGSGMRSASFLALHLGFDRGELNPLWFWLLNAGLFIPALAWVISRGPSRGGPPRAAVRFYAPFAFCFVVPNLFRLSPWIWDNIKFLVFWLVASAPFVGLWLAGLFRGGTASRLSGGAALLVLTLSGALDVWRVLAGGAEQRIFDREAVEFAEAAAAATPPRAVILSAPAHDSPVLLTGRRTVLGYPGHIWSQGLDAGTRGADVQAIYAGRAAARELLLRYGVSYMVVGPREEELGGGRERAAAERPMVQVGPYRLYRADVE
jgi:hypothetical protein